MSDKPLLWAGSALNDLRVFPADARREGGFQLRRVQRGLMPADLIVYIVKFAEGVYVLHAFEKRTRRTRGGDLALARKCLAAVLHQRGSS